ncbi:uncharacterized protein N7496_009115 [Penicillium cataractarum]|uniref:SH3 domain-containing protein n=1 Tax=Penicillium cataractarum TaxID=2100454 RepID=A0A9W9V7K1_9EURO|nr:uncharacterized protein N7496_009115 [Penicillium cataractarum]KAJ5369355.1 hypothetical protein N7496_009115 [Penicillium cataractarum]
MLMIVGWFKRQSERKKPILATYQQPTIDPTVQKERFAAVLFQSKGLVTSFLAMRGKAISSIVNSLFSSKSTAEIGLKDGATTLPTRRSLIERTVEQKTRIIMHTVVKISNFRRWISNPLGRERADKKAFVEKDEDILARSSLDEGSEGSLHDVAVEQTHQDTSYRVVSKIRPPPPVIIVERTRRRSESGLKVAPHGPVSPDTVCLEDVCAANESSDTLRGSETKSLQTIDECHGLGQSPSVGLLRLNVYRVEMEFVPRRDTQLGVSQGDEVVMTRVFDDGWPHKFATYYTCVAYLTNFTKFSGVPSILQLWLLD